MSQVIDAPMSGPLELARRLHDTVAQRLAGLSYVLSGGEPPREDTIVHCRHEIDAALDELRDALSSIGSSPDDDLHPEATAEWHRLRERFPGARLDLPIDDVLIATHPRSLVAAFLVEALRNVRKHAKPTRVTLEVASDPEVTFISVVNDGVGPGRGPSCGAGRRLLQLHASLHGGLVESAQLDAGVWRQRLILPAAELAAA